jgi:multicomponent Na+:H+ antiporter subunit A
MFVVLRLPPLKTISSRVVRLRDGLLASAFGALITLLLMKAVNIQFSHAISDKLAAMSYPEAKGKNVVNVILVDFRAMDTLGEIVVVTVAALGIAALVSTGLKKRKGGAR